MQLIGAKPGVGYLPLTKFWNRMMELYDHPRARRQTKELVASIVGAHPELLERLATDQELARAASMSFEQLAAEALGAKQS